MQGVGPSDLQIDKLIDRVAEGGIREVILAISTSVEGETTLFYIMNRLRQYPSVKVTTIARGIGFGDELEYVDELTITHALRNRREAADRLDTAKRQNDDGISAARSGRRIFFCRNAQALSGTTNKIGENHISDVIFVPDKRITFGTAPQGRHTEKITVTDE